jgi:putative ABC transport system permease protein
MIPWRKLRSVVQRRARERDMDDEMRFHVETEAAELMRGGMSADEAHRLARATFGGIERHKDDARDSVGLRLLDDLVQDLRYAVRQLRASPGFTAATIVTLALGVGATTTIFAIERTVTASDLAFARPDELVHLAQGTGGDCNACWRLAKGNYMTVRDESRTLVGVTLVADWSAILRGPEHTEIVSGALVTPAMFQMLGVPAMLGRTITPADTSADARNVVVIAENLWRNRFAADPGVVGSKIVLDAVPRTIVGVIADRFAFPQRAVVWAPRILGPSDASDRSWTNDNAIARLRPGVALPEARAELAGIGARLAVEYPSAMKHWTIDAISFREWSSPSRGDRTEALLYVAVGLVLLIACINLAGLLIARLTVRQKEIAVRAAMGASTGRIARQLLAETVLLTIVSGAAGAAVAAAAVRAVRDSMPSFIVEQLPSWPAMRMDIPSLLIALGTGALTGFVIGLWPAWRFGRPMLVNALKDGARNASSAGGASRTRRALVVAEVAFAIVLLAAAGLLARTLRNLHSVQPGFRADHLLTFRVTGPPHLQGDSTPVDSLKFERLARLLDQVPGVVRAAPVYGAPYTHSASTNGFGIRGAESDRPGHRFSVQMVPAGVDYFSTLEIPIKRGRSFTEADRPDAARVAVIDETVARQFFKDLDPIGEYIKIDTLYWQVVGIAGDTRYGARNRKPAIYPGEIYRPIAQWPWRQAQFVVRTRGNPLDVAPTLQRVVRDFDRDLAVTRIQTMTSVIEEDVAPDRLISGMMLGFAGAAVLIAAIGLYGVISYGVTQRVREFGIRRALGAESSALVSLVLGQGVRLAGIGAFLGVIGAIAATRLMRSVLYGVSPGDPLTLGGVVVAMCIVGLAASYIPARRASLADPMVSLREE